YSNSSFGNTIFACMLSILSCDFFYDPFSTYCHSPEYCRIPELPVPSPHRLLRKSDHSQCTEEPKQPPPEKHLPARPSPDSLSLTEIPADCWQLPPQLNMVPWHQSP